MKRVGSIISVFCCLLLAVACATQHSVSTERSTSVHVKVAWDIVTIGDRFAREVRDATVSAIARRTPKAGPLTVAITLRHPFSGGMYVPASSYSRQILPYGDLSDATPAVVEEHQGGYFAGRIVRTEIEGKYTISDATGRVIESDAIHVDADEIPSDRSLARQTGEIIAARVKALTE